MAKKIELNKEQQELYNEMKKLSKVANQRILRIERRFGENSWGINKLRNRLDSYKLEAWTEGNRVRVSKKYSEMQMKSIIVALNKFINEYKTSTVQGIKKIRKEQIESIYRRYKYDVESTFTYEDAETFYRMFSDTDYTFFVPKYIKASDFWAVIAESKDVNASYETFEDMFVRIANLEVINDIELLARLKAIYEKYVKE